MAEDTHSSAIPDPGPDPGPDSEPQYGPTYYAPVELPLPRLPRPPFWMVALALVSVVATWLPLAIIARARVSTSSEPRIQLLQDMAIQPKFREQETNPLFEDDRAMRPKIPGTIAFGSLQTDDNYYHGFVRQLGSDGNYTVVFADHLPAKFTDTQKHLTALLQRGQQRFNIYCYVCHGFDGSGHGPVNERAMQLKATDTDPQHPLGITWTPAAQLYSDTIRAQPDGKLFNTISNGIRTMPAYGPQIPVDDRWAIVAYVRALQLSEGGMPAGSLTPQQRDALKGQ